MSAVEATVRERPTTRRLRQQSALTKVLRDYDFALPLTLTITFVVANLVTEGGGFVLTQQLANAAPLAIAAVASAPSIMGGGLDLSISPLIYMINAIFIMWLAPHGLGGAVSVPIMLGVGLTVGALTGSLIVLLRVEAIVVTLGMYFALQGVDLVIAPNPTSHSAGWMSHLANSVGPVPGGLIMILLPLVIWWGLRFTPFRNYLFAVGSSPETAYASGVNVSAIRVGSYALGGLFAGVGAIALTGLVQSVTASNATEYTLEAIAGVTLGGISLAGGRGRLFGAALGACTIYLLQNLLQALQVNSAYLQVIYGVILLAAVIVTGAVTGGYTRRGGAVLPNLRRRRGAPEASGAEMVARIGISSVDDTELAGQDATRDTAPWRRALDLQRRFPLVQILVLLAIFFYGDLTLSGFASWGTIKVILLMAGLVGLASGGQTLLILMGGFDLSVAGFIVAGAVTTTALVSQYHLGFGLAIAYIVIGSGLLGGAAGWLCHRFRIQPLIVTLAIGSIAVGIVQVQATVLTGASPAWLANLAEPAAKTLGVGVPPVVVLWVLVAIAFGLFLHRTVAGRHVLATGANPEAAEFALISTRRVWTACFAFSAIASALVGVLIAAYSGGASASLGDPYLFQSVVAVVIGGTIFGGPGDYTRTCIGALLLTVLTIVLVGHGAGTAVEDIVYGVVILAAMAMYGRRGRLGASV